MSANRIFLVCSHHKSFDQALLVSERTDAETQYTFAVPKRADEWFAKHQACGRGCDHFQIAYMRPMDWDVSPPAEETVAGGVRLALIDGGSEQ